MTPALLHQPSMLHAPPFPLQGVWEPKAVIAFLDELVNRSAIRDELAQPGGWERLGREVAAQHSA